MNRDHGTSGINQGEIPNIISDFVDSVREDTRRVPPRAETPTAAEVDLQERAMDRNRRILSELVVPEKDQTQDKLDSTVIEVEKFKAMVAQPGILSHNQLFANYEIVTDPLAQQQQGGNQHFSPVNGNNRQELIPNIGAGVSDDDFFHLTWHIDPNLIHKIEKGEFIELEKLLPKDKINKGEDCLEWVQRDGGTFLVPAQKDVRISSFRKWEQAFRAYATIYCGANPHRSKEI